MPFGEGGVIENVFKETFEKPVDLSSNWKLKPYTIKEITAIIPMNEIVIFFMRQQIY